MVREGFDERIRLELILQKYIPCSLVDKQFAILQRQLLSPFQGRKGENSYTQDRGLVPISLQRSLLL
jgi:hypothetical protein